LARREAAIVSETAGTTRDVIEVQLDLEGYPVVIADTAGIRETHDALEQEGVRRALDRAAGADLKVVLLDGERPDAEIVGLVDEGALPVLNKIDLRPMSAGLSVNGIGVMGVSAKSGEGIERLLTRLGAEVRARFAVTSTALLTRARHREALEACVEALMRAWPGGGLSREPELIAEDLRLAGQALGRITGRVGVEDLLDKIFSDFCIGK